MTQLLTKEAQEFITERVFAHIGTLMKDGSPHVTTTWVDTDGDSIIINSGFGRTKVNNLERDGRIALSIMGENSQRCLWIRGTVSSITPDGANDHIDLMSMKYTGNKSYQGHRPGETRCMIFIRPTRVIERGV